MMLSRVADNLYWMGRYLERAEHTLRLLKVGLDMQFDLQLPDIGWTWERLAHSLNQSTLNDGTEQDDFEMVKRLVLDEELGASIYFNIRAARDNARQVREQISTEMWEQLNRLFLGLSNVDLEAEWDDNIFEFFQQQLRELYLFEGITNSTISHGAEWQFLQVGRLIERSKNTVMLLDFYASDWKQSNVKSNQQYLNLVMLLRDCTASEAYCKVYSADLRFPQIIEFLLLNADFPHAIHHSVLSIKIALGHIARMTNTVHNNRLNRLIGKLTADLSFAQVDEVLEDDLQIFLAKVQKRCDQIDAAVHHTYVIYPIEEKLPSRF